MKTFCPVIYLGDWTTPVLGVYLFSQIPTLICRLKMKGSVMKSASRFFVGNVLALSLLSVVGCATLLMLPDEVSEDHYRSQSGDQSAQIKSKMAMMNPGAKLTARESKEVGILPVVYIYDTTNTLKKNEEVYYTSIFNNSTGSWIRPFAVSASNAIRDELTTRGFKPFIYANSDLVSLGMEDINALLGDLTGTTFKAVAYNGDSRETNYAMTDVTQFRRAIVGKVDGVAFMKIKADWEPSSANTLNGDIVLNTGLKLGYEIVLCGADSGCTTAATSYDKGLMSNLFMPNRNTINDTGLDKNYELLRDLHEAQLKQIVKIAFERFDQQGTFKD